MAQLTLREYFKIVSSNNKFTEYTGRYHSIKGNVVVKWFKLKDCGHMVLHYKIPSEKRKNLMYDTLIEFCTDRLTDNALRNAPIRVFSNCPSYVFMNARFADMNGFSIPWANPLFNKETLERPSEEDQAKLPTEIRIERGLFFPLFHAKNMSAIQVMDCATNALPIKNGEELTKFIKSQDWVLEKRGQAPDMKRMADILEKFNPFSKKKKDKDGESTASSPYVKKVTKTGRVAKTKSVSKIKSI